MKFSKKKKSAFMSSYCYYVKAVVGGKGEPPPTLRLSRPLIVCLLFVISVNDVGHNYKTYSLFHSHSK